MPLQLACQIAGTPVPDSAMRNAEDPASSLASQVTTTVTMGGETGGSAALATPSGSSYYIEHSVSTATMTTTQGWSTLTLVFPVTIERTSTLLGSPSTRTISSSSIFSASTFTSTPAASSTGSSTRAVSSSDLSTLTVTTSVAPASTSSDEGEGASKTSSAQSEDSTNSSPFKDSNVGSAHRDVDGNWLGLAIVIVAVCLWF